MVWADLSSGYRRTGGLRIDARFRRADGSIDSFHDLLPAAEETGLSISIGREALETVCRPVAQLERHPSLKIR